MTKEEIEMSIENMTVIDWLIIIGLGITGGLISFLATSFINWLRGNYDTVKTNDEGAKNGSKGCKSRSDLVLPTVQVRQEIQEEVQQKRTYNGEYKTVTVTIDKIPYNCRHTLCFDCEYCCSDKPYIKECSRSTQKIVWNPVSKKGYCLNREENED